MDLFLSLGYNDDKARCPVMEHHPGQRADRFGRSGDRHHFPREPFTPPHEGGGGCRGGWARAAFGLRRQRG